jgi:uncharacterized RDD family membrane protein YckC
MHAYRSRDGSVIAPYADFWDRVLALLIDGVLCLFIPTTAASIALVVSEDLVLPLAVLIGFGYFAIGAYSGGTLGARAMRLRVVDVRTGRTPGIARALARGCCSTLLVVSGITMAMFGFSDEPTRGYSDLELRIIAALGIAFALSVVARLWLVADLEGRTLTDRIAGVAVIHPEARTSPLGQVKIDV